MPGCRLLHSLPGSEHHMAPGLSTWPCQIPGTCILFDLSAVGLQIAYRHTFDPMWQGMGEQALYLARVQVIRCPEHCDIFSCFSDVFLQPSGNSLSRDLQRLRVQNGL